MTVATAAESIHISSASGAVVLMAPRPGNKNASRAVASFGLVRLVVLLVELKELSRTAAARSERQGRDRVIQRQRERERERGWEGEREAGRQTEAETQETERQRGADTQTDSVAPTEREARVQGAGGRISYWQVGLMHEAP